MGFISENNKKNCENITDVSCQARIYENKFHIQYPEIYLTKVHEG